MKRIKRGKEIGKKQGLDKEKIGRGGDGRG